MGARGVRRWRTLGGSGGLNVPVFDSVQDGQQSAPTPLSVLECGLLASAPACLDAQLQQLHGTGRQPAWVQVAAEITPHIHEPFDEVYQGTRPRVVVGACACFQRRAPLQAGALWDAWACCLSLRGRHARCTTWQGGLVATKVHSKHWPSPKLTNFVCFV